MGASACARERACVFVACDAQLDWDALALQARRPKVPLGMCFARGNDAFQAATTVAPGVENIFGPNDNVSAPSTGVGRVLRARSARSSNANRLPVAAEPPLLSAF